MIELRFERTVAAPPEVLWPYLAEPALMNLWSSAAIESVALGDGGHPCGVGALRTVRIAGPRPVVLEEVIEASEFPHRLTYRVIRGAPVRSHHGVITIAATAAGSRLTWQVDIDGGARATEWLIERILRPRLDASLDALVKRHAAGIAPPSAPLPPPSVRDLDERSPIAAALAEARRCADEQTALADRLLDRNDPNGWFARVYQYVSERQIAACEAERFDHPAWVLRLVPVFHRHYMNNLLPALGEADGELEAHWRRAFVATRRASDTRTPFEAAAIGLYTGMRAHIEFDLPRALAEVHARHYRGLCDYARFRADFLRMAPIFAGASDQLLADLPRNSWPLKARVMDRMTPDALRSRSLERRFYPVRSRRREAFERGAGIARLIDHLVAAAGPIGDAVGDAG